MSTEKSTATTQDFNKQKSKVFFCEFLDDRLSYTWQDGHSMKQSTDYWKGEDDKTLNELDALTKEDSHFRVIKYWQAEVSKRIPQSSDRSAYYNCRTGIKISLIYQAIEKQLKGVVATILSNDEPLAAEKVKLPNGSEKFLGEIVIERNLLTRKNFPNPNSTFNILVRQKEERLNKSTKPSVQDQQKTTLGKKI